jgi:hypothetical protein
VAYIERYDKVTPLPQQRVRVYEADGKWNGRKAAYSFRSWLSPNCSMYRECDFKNGMRLIQRIEPRKKR